jgi:hypothetical protein
MLVVQNVVEEVLHGIPLLRSHVPQAAPPAQPLHRQPAAGLDLHLRGHQLGTKSLRGGETSTRIDTKKSVIPRA